MANTLYIRTQVRVILLSLVVLLHFNLFSQIQSPCSGITMSSRVLSSSTELNSWLKAFSNDTSKFLNYLNSCYTDSLLIGNEYSSINLLNGLSVKSSSLGVKRESIRLYLTLAKSKSSTIAALAVKALMAYPRGIFNSSDFDSISTLITANASNYKDLVELAGYLNRDRFIPPIRAVFPNTRNFTKPEQWATYKTLARLGDKDALDYCLKRISALPVNDQVVDVLYPDLIYLHRKEAIDLIIKELFTDKPLCTSTNPNSDGKILCGYRIMELLAPVIVDFPVKLLPSGDLDCKDYRKTLKRVRGWFKKKGNAYSIVNLN